MRTDCLNLRGLSLYLFQQDLVTIHHKYVWTIIGLSHIFFHKSSFVFQRKYVLLPLTELEGNLYFIILNAPPPRSISPIGVLFSIICLAVYYFSIARFRSTNAKFSCILARHMRPLIPT